jgi:predicted thioesterase
MSRLARRRQTVVEPAALIRSGELRHQAQLQSGTPVLDAIRGRLIVYATYATVPAKVLDVPFVVDEMNATVLRDVEIRHRADVLIGHRVLVQGLILKVLAKENPENLNRKLILHCAEVQA